MKELEKQFFDVFGIEPIKYKRNVEDNAVFMDRVYPPITDRILLELICIINQTDLVFFGENDSFMALDYEDLKEEVVAKCKRLADNHAYSEVTGEHIKHQVQELFKEQILY